MYGSSPWGKHTPTRFHPLWVSWLWLLVDQIRTNPRRRLLGAVSHSLDQQNLVYRQGSPLSTRTAAWLAHTRRMSHLVIASCRISRPSRFLCAQMQEANSGSWFIDDERLSFPSRVLCPAWRDERYSSRQAGVSAIRKRARQTTQTAVLLFVPVSRSFFSAFVRAAGVRTGAQNTPSRPMGPVRRIFLFVTAPTTTHASDPRRL